ncbi:MAG: methyltransferase [Sphingomonadales bacterium]|nr:methyltransferase [Sphingomonadales bacterium]
MTANRSTAVMQRREPTSDERFGPRGFRTSLDYFPTPPWAARAACEFLARELAEPLREQIVWEPACGEGHMMRGLADYFGCAFGTDVHPFDGSVPHDFLMPKLPHAMATAPDWVATNPPFRLAREFVQRAIHVARRGVVMFVRSSFTEGDERHRAIFTGDLTPSYVVTYVERVVLLRDRLIRSGADDPFNLDKDGKPIKASSATSYALVIWLPGQHDTRHRWIPKCRLRMERPGDYPKYPDQWAAIAHAQTGDLL